MFCYLTCTSVKGVESVLLHLPVYFLFFSFFFYSIHTFTQVHNVTIIFPSDTQTQTHTMKKGTEVTQTELQSSSYTLLVLHTTSSFHAKLLLEPGTSPGRFSISLSVSIPTTRRCQWWRWWWWWGDRSSNTDSGGYNKELQPSASQEAPAAPRPSHSLAGCQKEF